MNEPLPTIHAVERGEITSSLPERSMTPIAPELAEAGMTVLIPAFNEEGIIEKTIEQVHAALRPLELPFEVIVIDDGSRDRTGEIVSGRADATLLRHEVNRGYGASLKTGIRKARYGWIAIVDADGTYPIADLPKLAAELPRYDMVVGARAGKHVKIPLIRRPPKWVLGKFANWLSGHKIPDLNSGMRIFRRDLAQRFVEIFPDGFSFTTTITIAALTNGYGVKFVAIDYFKRVGKSSMRARDFVNMMILVLRLATYFKPLNVFLPAAAVLFTVGFAKAIVDLVRTNAFGVGSSLAMLIAVQIAFMGLLADLILRRTRM